MAPPSALSKIATVFVILMENTNWAQVTSTEAPFIVNTLVANYSSASNYKTPRGLHPSEPNYIWLEAGTNFGVRDDSDPSPSRNFNTSLHLTALLRAKGISWKSYQEDITGKQCPITSHYPYAAKHNPFVFFSDVTDNLNASSAYCISHIRPFYELKTDLANNNTARYNFITPNLCDDGHDCPLSYVDNWLRQNLGMIMKSSAFLNNGVIFLTWDEGAWATSLLSASDGPIGFLAISPLSKPGYIGSTPYTHSSTLRTLQDIFAVQPYLGDAANAVNLADLFVSPSPAATFSPSIAIASNADLELSSMNASLAVVGIAVAILAAAGLALFIRKKLTHQVAGLDESQHSTATVTM